MTEPYDEASTRVHTEVNPECTLVQMAPETIPDMPGTGKRRRDAPSVQLQRFRWLILQMEQSGHPDWFDDDGKPMHRVTNAELARRTGLTTSYLNAIKHPDRSRNTDVGGAIIAQMCDRVGLDVDYFYEKYKEERPFHLYLLSAKREEKRAESILEAVQVMRADYAQLRREIAERDARHARDVERLERELADARSKAGNGR
jgi:transcriptional regulator with XRE-family HTH domain